MELEVLNKFVLLPKNLFKLIIKDLEGILWKNLWDI